MKTLPFLQTGTTLLECCMSLVVVAAFSTLFVAGIQSTNRRLGRTHSILTGKNIIQNMFHLPAESLEPNSPLYFDEHGLPTQSTPSFTLTVQKEPTPDFDVFHFHLTLLQHPPPHNTLHSHRRIWRHEP